MQLVRLFDGDSDEYGYVINKYWLCYIVMLTSYVKSSDKVMPLANIKKSPVRKCLYENRKRKHLTMTMTMTMTMTDFYFSSWMGSDIFV